MDVNNNHEIADGWRVLIACFIGMTLAVGTIVTYTSGIITSAIATDFGWSKVDLAVPLACFYYALVPGSLICGWLTDRRGPRSLILGSTALLAVGLACLAALPPSRAAFAVAFTLLALVSIGTLPVSYARVITANFERRRGLALGITLTGVGVGGAFWPLLTQALISFAGWRAAYLALAGLVTGLSLPLAWAFIPPSTPGASVTAVASNVIREAFGERPSILVMLGALSLLSGVMLTGLVVHLVPILQGWGYGARAVGLAGLMGVSIIIGRLLIGALMDRLAASRVLALFLLGPCAGALLLASGGIFPLAAILIGLAQGAEVDAVAFLVSRHFRSQHFGVVYGTMFALFTAGAANGPLLLAMVSSADGSYGRALVLIAGVAALTSAISFFLPQPITLATARSLRVDDPRDQSPDAKA